MCINNLNPSNSLLHRAMISVLVQNLVNRKLPNTEKEIRFYQSILCREVVLHKTNIVLKISDILKYIEWMKDIDVDKLTYGNADLNPLPAVLSSLGYVDLEQAKISKMLDVIATYNKVFPGNNLFLNVDFLSEKTVFNIHKLVVDSCESISSSKFMILLPVIYRMSGFFDLKDALEEGTDYERKSYDCSLLQRALAFHREEIALEDFVPSEVVLDCRFLKEPDQTLLKQLFLGCESLHLQNCNKYPFLKSVIAAVVEEKSFTTIKCQTLILGSISLRQKSEGHNVLLLASKAKKELTLTCSSINSRLNFEYLNFQTSLESLSLVFPKNRVPLIFLRKILEIAPQLTQLNLNFKSANLTHEHIDLIRQIFEKAKKLKSLTLAGIAVDISNCINVLPKSLSKLHYVCPIGTNIQKVMLVLEEFENLHDLTLWAYKATGLVESFEACLIKILRKNHSLTSLEIDFLEADDISLTEKLGDALLKCLKIEKLTLCHINLLKTFLSHIMKIKRLTKIDFSNSTIGEDVLSEDILPLDKERFLTTYSLPIFDFESMSLKIVDFLKLNSSLLCLYLPSSGSNEIQKEIPVELQGRLEEYPIY